MTLFKSPAEISEIIDKNLDNATITSGTVAAGPLVEVLHIAEWFAVFVVAALVFVLRAIIEDHVYRVRRRKTQKVIEAKRRNYHPKARVGDIPS